MTTPRSLETTSGSGRRLAVVLAALGALPAFLVADTLLARARGWHIRSDFDTAVLGLGAVPLGVLALLVLWPRGRRFLVRRFAPLTLLGCTVLVALLAAELVLHLAKGSAEYWFHLRGPGLTRVFHPRPDVLPGVTGESRYTTNARGMRGPEMPPRADAWRVLCVGGSTTECLYLDDAEAWPHLLMRRLETDGRGRVWVGDVGKSAYATADHVQYLLGSNILSEIDCLVLYVGANDHGRALLGRPLLATVDLEPVWMGSHVLQALRRVVEIWGGRRRHRVEGDDASDYVVRRRERQAATQTDVYPDPAPALGAYRRNLRWILAAARAHGVRVVCVGQAVLWRAGLTPEEEALLWMGWTTTGMLTPAKLREGIDAFNAALAQEARAAGAAYVDPSPMSGDARYFYDDMHLNEAGARALADLVAPALEAARDADGG